MNIRALDIRSTASGYFTRLPSISSVDIRTAGVALRTFASMLIPRGLTGFTANYIGWILGTLYITPVAGLISSRVMTSAMSVACRLYGESMFGSFVARCGALYMAEKAVTPLVILFGGIATGYAFVLVTNAAGIALYKVFLEGDSIPIVVTMDKLPSEIAEVPLLSNE